jgi:hypothetical protein
MGYFDLVDQVDLFVVLDSVQFEKQSWQQRNRIKAPGGLQWLTVPVHFRGRLGQSIKDVEIRQNEFWRNHVRAIELAYRRCPFFERYFPQLADLLQGASAGLLLELNFSLLRWLLEVLEIRTPTVAASSLGQGGKRTELLANICQELGATEYISPLGAAGYLLPQQNILQVRGIQISFQNYEHPTYRQAFPPFEPFASVIDLLFNEGEKSPEILRGGRKRSYSVEELALPARTG